MTGEDFKREIFPLKNRIFRFAKSLLDFSVEAEDATQDVFMKLWSRKHELEGIQNIEAFAMTVTRNICLDRLKSKRVTIIELPQFDEAAVIRTVSFDPAMTDQKAIVGKMIRQLPEQQRMILQLREIEGYEFAQIAEITGMNENTVRVNLSRARKTLKEELSKIHEYGLKVGGGTAGKVL